MLINNAYQGHPMAQSIWHKINYYLALSFEVMRSQTKETWKSPETEKYKE